MSDIHPVLDLIDGAIDAWETSRDEYGLPANDHAVTIDEVSDWINRNLGHELTGWQKQILEHAMTRPLPKGMR